MVSQRCDVIVYFDGTFMQRVNGAHARAETLLRFLTEHFDNVVLYSFHDHPTCPWTDAHIAAFAADHPDVRLVLERRSRALLLVTRLKTMMMAIEPRLARRMTALTLPGATPAYAALLREHPAAPLIANYAEGLVQLNGIDGRPVFVETHDLAFISYRYQRHMAASALRPVLKLRIEVALLDLARAVIAISDMEASIFRMLLDHADVLCIPDFNRRGPPAVAESTDDAADFDLVFVGSDNILNVEGLVKFLDDHGSWLASRRLAICGKVCDQAPVIHAAQRVPGAVLLGFVDDMSAIYRRSKAAVSPVVGTGLKIKIVDALSHGKPVFASPSSLAGLPAGYDGCVFPIERQAMHRIFDDAACRRDAERRSRSYLATFSRTGDQGMLLALLGESAPARGEAGGELPKGRQVPAMLRDDPGGPPRHEGRGFPNRL